MRRRFARGERPEGNRRSPPAAKLIAMHDARQVLQTLWGYTDFRPQQRPIVEAVAGGRDVLAVLPTGGGKSVAFQVPALLASGTTLVVTPLVALMEDQVARLRSLRVAAACLHGEQPAAVRSESLAGIETGRWALLYLSPETLLSPPVWARLQGCPIARMVLDEAHCLTGWGSSFRPDYHRLGAARRALGHPPLCAFTATATPADRARIEQWLGLVEPVRLVIAPYRPNLAIRVRWMYSTRQRCGAVGAFLASRPDTSGLVYLRTRAGTEKLARELAKAGYRTTHYHAGLGAAARRRAEGDWLAGRLQFLVATNAFGMGVDAPHVRWVIHAHTPPSLEEYLQEIGRAGRDGEAATALLLASEPTGWLDPTDRLLHRHFAANRREQWQTAEKALARLPAQGDFRPELALSLALLHERDRLVWETPFRYRLVAAPPIRPPEAGPLVQDFVRTRRCRWQFLMAAFGEAASPPCGRCDRCTSRTFR
ncbi:RecQ family ATP-dependent DNA helicase [Gloeobacter morelensis]|nr:RecQ family ATP-dependent DNA helicase [Gloeobacter morelensis]